MLAYKKIAVSMLQRVELENYYEYCKSRSLMRMQNLSSMEVLDTHAPMHRFVIAVSDRIYKD